MLRVWPLQPMGRNGDKISSWKFQVVNIINSQILSNFRLTATSAPLLQQWRPFQFVGYFMGFPTKALIIRNVQEKLVRGELFYCSHDSCSS